jgi:hypothetical protein
MPPLQDGEAFWGGLSTGVTRGYYHPAPLGRNIRGGVNDPCGGADAYGRLTWASFVSEARPFGNAQGGKRGPRRLV